MTARYFSPPQLAELFAVNPSKVIGWIRSGELRATNVAANLIGRPRWRISPADLAVFQQRRSAVTPIKTRQRRKVVGVIEFF